MHLLTSGCHHVLRRQHSMLQFYYLFLVHLEELLQRRLPYYSSNHFCYYYHVVAGFLLHSRTRSYLNYHSYLTCCPQVLIPISELLCTELVQGPRSHCQECSLSEAASFVSRHLLRKKLTWTYRNDYYLP